MSEPSAEDVTAALALHVAGIADDQHAEVLRLRARLAEVQAERDAAALSAERHREGTGYYRKMAVERGQIMFAAETEHDNLAAENARLRRDADDWARAKRWYELKAELEEAHGWVSLLFAVYETWWHKVGCLDAGDGLAASGYSLISSADQDLMEAACLPVEPHEGQIRELLAALADEDGPRAQVGTVSPAALAGLIAVTNLPAAAEEADRG